LIKGIDFHAQSLEKRSTLDSLENRNEKRKLKHCIFIQSKFEFGGIIASVEE